MDSNHLDIIGHRRALDLLEQMILSGRLGSALLLVGAEGIGKRKIADFVVEAMRDLPVGKQGLSLQADLMIVERQLNDQDELKKNISIEQVRQMIARLSMTSFSGGQKIGLIDGADFLSIEAANALLKTLEDPLGNVLVILLARSTVNIPATVLSRCQTIHLPLVSSEEICDALVARGLDRQESHEIAGLAAGRPGVALRLFDSQEIFQSYKSYQTNLQDLLTKSLPQRLGQFSELGKMNKAELEVMFDVWELFLYHAQNYSSLKRLLRSRAAIRQNVSPTLALEHAFI